MIDDRSGDDARDLQEQTRDEGEQVITKLSKRELRRAAVLIQRQAKMFDAWGAMIHTTPAEAQQLENDAAILLDLAIELQQAAEADR